MTIWQKFANSDDFIHANLLYVNIEKMKLHNNGNLLQTYQFESLNGSNKEKFKTLANKPKMGQPCSQVVLTSYADHETE